MTTCNAEDHEESTPPLTTGFLKKHCSLKHPAHENISRSHVQACTNEHCTKLTSGLIDDEKGKTT